MDIIFDIKSDSDWAKPINEEINNSFPDYFSSNPLVGTEDWWKTANIEISNGKITHVGNLIDDGELLDLVVIQPLDDDLNGDTPYDVSQPEFSVYREDFWLNSLVQVSKFVQIKSVTICPSGELDENAIYIETEVHVW